MAADQDRRRGGEFDSPIRAEQRHLDEARRQLRRMRERTASMTALAGDRFSGEYLRFTLWKRMKALEDDPDVPLFFGRLDYGATASGDLGHPGETFYVGRRHITDEHGEPMVVDWRAPVSRPFYRASPAEPMGVERRRRFGFVRGAVTSYEDESLTRRQASADGHSAILEAEIERPRVGPMRDIVATIQPEQDEIVRAGLADTVCVQGAPGTGKTAVGLHRAAYLLYAHRDQLTRQGVLVIGPNASFLRYIGDVLPALGEIDARQTTVEDLVACVAISRSDAADVASVKGDERMARVVEAAIWSQLVPAREALVVPIGARRFRVPGYEADELVDELRSRGVRYGAGRAMLAQRLAHTILVKMELAGDSPDDRVQNAVARSRPVRRFIDAVWPAVDAIRIVMRLLGEPDFLARAAAGILDANEQAAIGWPRPAKGPRGARWSVHDAVMIDEARDKIERTPSLGHVVLDEAQDLSPMMLRSVGRRCSTGSATILGDLAQATTSWAVGSWHDALAHLGKPGAHVEELTDGFRVPADVIEYAAQLLPVIAPTLAPPRSVRRARGELTLVATPEPVRRCVDAVHDTLRLEGSIGVIVPDGRVSAVAASLRARAIEASIVGATLDEVVDDEASPEPRVSIIGASVAKGLEFDHVVLVEPAAIAASEADPVTGLRRLYVCLTRAVSSLVILYADPLPAPLRSR